MKNPRISVLLPVYNGQDFLTESIESILGQTFSDFELIILNDGSFDGSESIARGFLDKRIRYYAHSNLGLAKTLNIGIKHARASLIARQDQDDISLPNRLLSQYKYLVENPQIIMCGTQAAIISEDGKLLGDHIHPTTYVGIKQFLLYDNPFVHSSILMRTDSIKIAGLYCEDTSRQPPEDYELWSRLSRIGELVNINEELVLYRETSNGMSRKRTTIFTERIVNISAENLTYAAPNIDSYGQHRYLARLYHGFSHKELTFHQLLNSIKLQRTVSDSNTPNSIDEKNELDRIIARQNLRLLINLGEKITGVSLIELKRKILQIYKY